MPKISIIEDPSFPRALEAALQEQSKDRSIRPQGKITSLNFYNFIQKTTVKDFQSLKQYSKDEIRFLPKSWNYVEITPQFLAKQLTQFYTNSGSHLEATKKIGLKKSNAFIWISAILEDKLFSPIQFYEYKKTGFAIVYDLPIPLSLGKNRYPTSLPSNWPLGLNVLNYRLVINYHFIYTRPILNKEKKGTAITGFLVDRPFTISEMDNLKNVSSIKGGWLKDRNALAAYQNYSQNGHLAILKPTIRRGLYMRHLVTPKAIAAIKNVFKQQSAPPFKPPSPTLVNILRLDPVFNTTISNLFTALSGSIEQFHTSFLNGLN